jgi:hypothetical protein
MAAIPPVLAGPVQVRTAENGFIAVYLSKEYVFLTVGALNAWMATISAGG